MEHEKLSYQDTFRKMRRLMNRYKKGIEIDEAMTFVSPHHVIPSFFKTGDVGGHQTIYLKESPVSQHGVQGLPKTYKPK
jgi:hypothetical protein